MVQLGSGAGISLKPGGQFISMGKGLQAVELEATTENF